VLADLCADAREEAAGDLVLPQHHAAIRPRRRTGMQVMLEGPTLREAATPTTEQDADCAWATEET
jgi:hypothetical protein